MMELISVGKRTSKFRPILNNIGETNNVSATLPQDNFAQELRPGGEPLDASQSNPIKGIVHTQAGLDILKDDCYADRLGTPKRMRESLRKRN